MPISINGSGTVTGVSVGGLPDGIVDTDMLAANAVTAAKRGAGAILQVVQKKLTGSEFSTSSQTFVEVTGLAQTLTLSSASNKVLIDVNLHTSCQGASYMRARSQLRFGDFSTADGLSTNMVGVYNLNGGQGTETVYIPHTHQVLHTPSTATPTYRMAVRLIESSQTLNIFADGNVDGIESSITFTEIAA